MDAADLDEQSRKTLQKFIEAEQRRADFNSRVHQYTDICFDKCISTIGKTMSKGEETCMTQCVDRFVDSAVHIVRKLQETQGH